MQNNGKETERKYLIKYPDIVRLTKESFEVREITQTYLTSEVDADRRVRASCVNGRTTYTFTEKRKISALTRYEDEKEITKEEYEALLLAADKSFYPVHKTRYCIPAGERVAEVDVYSGISGFAICEVELESEDEMVTLPDCVILVREVTGEREYSNRNIARMQNEK